MYVNNISHVAINQVINAEWVEASSRRCGAINKDYVIKKGTNHGKCAVKSTKSILNL
jgi:hypothetical protein